MAKPQCHLLHQKEFFLLLEGGGHRLCDGGGGGFRLEVLGITLLGSALEGLLSLGLLDGDNIREGRGDTVDTLGVIGHHDFDLDADHTLFEVDVAGGGVNVLARTVAGLDHVT